MQPYCNLKNAHKDFFLHMYEDIKHYLLCNSNKTYQDVIEYIKKKYTFYDFSNDPFLLFLNFEKTLIHKMIYFIKQYIQYNTIETLRIQLYREFNPFISNKTIFTFQMASIIDKEIFHKETKYWYKDYLDDAIDIGLFTCNIKD